VLLIYDGSFEGFLTAVFEVYERKIICAKIIREKLYQPDLSEEIITIVGDSLKSDRLWNGLKKKISMEKSNDIFKTFLSEQTDIEDVLLTFIRYVFSNDSNVEKDYGNRAVLAITQTARKVHREKHRMEAFVRFQLTKDDIYYSIIEPDFNVLPLIGSHFKERYADQHWIIFDKKRDYGIYYDKNTEELKEISMDLELAEEKQFLPESVCHENEVVYQTLWKNYFESVNIKARKNTKLHLRHVPTRYWKYLTEKQ
jgi:probable DNA metabolism protein